MGGSSGTLVNSVTNVDGRLRELNPRVEIVGVEEQDAHGPHANRFLDVGGDVGQEDFEVDDFGGALREPRVQLANVIPLP